MWSEEGWRTTGLEAGESLLSSHWESAWLGQVFWMYGFIWISFCHLSADFWSEIEVVYLYGRFRRDEQLFFLFRHRVPTNWLSHLLLYSSIDGRERYTQADCLMFYWWRNGALELLKILIGSVWLANLFKFVCELLGKVWLMNWSLKSNLEPLNLLSIKWVDYTVFLISFMCFFPT